MGFLSRLAAEALGELAGKQTAEGMSSVMTPQNEDERREASHQQVGYQKSLAGFLNTEEKQDAFDDGFTRGIAKARRRR